MAIRMKFRSPKIKKSAAAKHREEIPCQSEIFRFARCSAYVPRYEVRDSNFGDPVFGSLDFPTRRFARTLKNTRQSKQIKHIRQQPTSKQLPQIDWATSADWRFKKLPYSWILQRDTSSVHRVHRNAPRRLHSAAPRAMRRKLPTKRRNIRGIERTRTTMTRRTTKGSTGIVRPHISSCVEISTRVQRTKRMASPPNKPKQGSTCIMTYCVPTFAVPLLFHLILMKMIHSQR